VDLSGEPGGSASAERSYASFHHIAAQRSVVQKVARCHVESWQALA
jgi:hypothetical protein